MTLSREDPTILVVHPGSSITRRIKGKLSGQAIVVDSKSVEDALKIFSNDYCKLEGILVYTGQTCPEEWQTEIKEFLGVVNSNQEFGGTLVGITNDTTLVVDGQYDETCWNSFRKIVRSITTLIGKHNKIKEAMGYVSWEELRRATIRQVKDGGYTKTHTLNQFAQVS